MRVNPYCRPYLENFQGMEGTYPYQFPYLENFLKNRGKSNEGGAITLKRSSYSLS